MKMKNKTTLSLITVIIISFMPKVFCQVWTQQAMYPVAAGSDGGICFTLNNKIYVGGGINSKAFREYDPVTNLWTTKANIPGVISSRAFGIGFSVNGKGYVGLGLDGTTIKNDFWEYDAATDTWSMKSNYPGSGRDGLFSFVINNMAYAGGGEDPFTFTQYNSCYSYNPASDTWTPVANFPLPGII